MPPQGLKINTSSSPDRLYDQNHHQGIGLQISFSWYTEVNVDPGSVGSWHLPRIRASVCGSEITEALCDVTKLGRAAPP